MIVQNIKNRIFLLIGFFFLFLIGQTTLAAINKDHYLRRSCYCINCNDTDGASTDTMTQMQQSISDTGCRYVRWASFRWEDMATASASGATLLQQNLSRLTTLRNNVPAGVIVEFGIPEAVSKPFVQSLTPTSSEITTLNNLANQFNPTMSGFSSFTYSQLVISQSDTLDSWGAGVPSGIPALDTKSGWHYHLLLFKRAYDAGARGFYLSQANLRFANPSYSAKEIHFESLIKALRSYATTQGGEIIFGSESLAYMYQGMSPDTSLVDFVKYIADIDVSHKTGSTFFAYKYNAQILNCRGQSQLGPVTIPTTYNSASQLIGPLCIMESEPQGNRIFTSAHNYQSLSLEMNQGRWPVVYELDGAQECSFLANTALANNVVYYKNHGNETMTTCYSRVRNGLSNTMLFISQPKDVRRQFSLYAARYTQNATSANGGKGVYFPQMLKVDQNHFWQIADGYHHYITGQLNSTQFSEQTARVRLCPTAAEGSGKTYNNSGYYNARYCGDEPDVGVALSDSFINGSGYPADGGGSICQPNLQVNCGDIANGSRRKTCNSLGSAFGSCTTICNSGYTLSGGACVASGGVCTPYAVVSCGSIANGTNTKTCNASGTAYSSCTITCNSGYTLSGGACVASSSVPLHSILTKSQTQTMNNTQFVQALYRAILGIDGATADVNWWVGQLNSSAKTREGARLDFVYSSSFSAQFPSNNASWVTLVYRSLLRREPDSGGLNSWVNQLNGGMSRLQVIQAFHGSGEYASVTKD